ncbi:MAG TPA: pilus assembly protein TadG-related protein [Caulobacteraceae bacterium]|nr:pilus assembly protein TadG-related protein [Caulobacteraceae bacterium]
MIFALGAPSLALLACGAIDLASVNADRTAMQDTADATALAMAKQLGIATAAGITARAKDYAVGQLGPIAARDGVTVTTTIADDNASVTVSVDGARSSFFGNLLPPGGWKLHAQATASTLGQLPLCLLSSGSGGTDNLQVQSSSLLTADKCLVQSNQNIVADAGANLTAGLAQATGTATGPITPSPQSGAPSIADPFTSLSIPAPTPLACLLGGVLDLTQVLITPSPGCHTGNITVGKGQTMQLGTGTYYFKGGTLTIKDNAVLKGSNVTLIFDKDAAFNFTDTSTIDLTGAQSGSYAGFVIATTRDNANTFTISSDSAHKLEGAVYIPDATLQVTGTGNHIADQSAWTVVVARAVQLQGSANLVINANYAGSNVPVPAGAGDKYHSGKVALSK